MSGPIQAWLRRRSAAQAFDFEYTSSDVMKGRLSSLKAKADIINLKASGNPEWAIYYRELVQWHDKIQASSWWGFGMGTQKEIIRREQELASWQERLDKQGIDTGPRVVTPPPEPSDLRDLGSNLFKAAAVAGAVWLASKVLSK